MKNKQIFWILTLGLSSYFRDQKYLFFYRNPPSLFEICASFVFYFAIFNIGKILFSPVLTKEAKIKSTTDFVTLLVVKIILLFIIYFAAIIPTSLARLALDKNEFKELVEFKISNLQVQEDQGYEIVQLDQDRLLIWLKPNKDVYLLKNSTNSNPLIQKIHNQFLPTIETKVVVPNCQQPFFSAIELNGKRTYLNFESNLKEIDLNEVMFNSNIILEFPKEFNSAPTCSLPGDERIFSLGIVLIFPK